MQLYEDLKKEYFLSRDTVQLENPCIVEMRVKKYRDVSADDKNNVSVSLKVDKKVISKLQIKGILDATIKIEREKETLIEFFIIYQGFFVADEELEDFERRVYLQMVPQLWPYLRNAINNLSTMFNIPPVVLPTIDILKTLNKNQ